VSAGAKDNADSGGNALRDDWVSRFSRGGDSEQRNIELRKSALGKSGFRGQHRDHGDDQLSPGILHI
jgi:hypothetical protein